jgi:hypothetical protein
MGTVLVLLFFPHRCHLMAQLSCTLLCQLPRTLMGDCQHLALGHGIGTDVDSRGRENSNKDRGLDFGILAGVLG